MVAPHPKHTPRKTGKNGFSSLPRRAFWKTGNLQRRLHPPAKRRKFVYNKIGTLLSDNQVELLH
ncbi:MAG: hypothetical protein ACLTTF_05330, partial [Oscillospiraceae bacterium]